MEQIIASVKSNKAGLSLVTLGVVVITAFGTLLYYTFC